jgi:hypothetical protein
MAPELANARQGKDRSDARSQNEVCSGQQQGAAGPFRLRGVFAVVGTRIPARSFHRHMVDAHICLLDAESCGCSDLGTIRTRLRFGSRSDRN